MKLLRIISSVKPEKGGPINAAREIDTLLTQDGHRVDVLTLDGAFAVDYPGTVHFMGPSRFGYGLNGNIRPWLEQHARDYDFFIINGLWQYHGFVARQVLNKLGRPYIVYTHGMLDPWFKHAYPLKHLKKWLYWPWGEYRVLRDARRVVFTSEEERIRARESFWLYRANETITAYGTSSPPLDDARLAHAFVTEHPQLKGKRVVLFLSRIHEKKGCDHLLQAFAQVAGQDARLHLVMAGPDQGGWVQALQAQAVQLGIADRVTWPGMLQGAAKWGAFYAAEVFCLPSHQENFGVVVAEALACGKPVLISNKVNIWREIEKDAVGFVSDDTTAGALQNLQRWLQLDAPGYAQMSQRAKVCFTERFHIRRGAQRLLEIVRECFP